MATIAVCLRALTGPAMAAEQKPWNIVYIMADDMGYGDVGCFGATKIKTPAIDSMARDGMRCTAFYTQPVCGASRTACLTGCYPTRVKQYRHERNHQKLYHSRRPDECRTIL